MTVRDAIAGSLDDATLAELEVTAKATLDAEVIEPPAPGGPCWVVTREAWERFVCSYDDIGCNTKDDVLALFRDEANPHWLEQAEEHWKAAEDAASVAVSALLGNVRVAKTIEKASGLYHDATIRGPGSATVTFTSADEMWDEPRDVAVLEDE